MKARIMNGLAAAMVLLLVACASTPTWEGMSEQEISQWKGFGCDAATAQQWKADGFTAEQASGWKAIGFTRADASAWSRKSFSAAEAAMWKHAGFDLDDAIDARARGLAPIQPDKPAVAEPKAKS